MLEKKETRLCHFFVNSYRKRLNKYLKKNTKLDSEAICNDYIRRFYECMNGVDMGKNRGRFTSYLNIFSGLAAYEILREKGLTEKEGIEAYDYMCLPIRKLASFMYRTVDLFPGSYKTVVKSLKKDLNGPKAICWDTKILKDDKEGFTYEISKCLYFDTCKEHGYPEFCKVFCTHDWYSFGVLRRHSKFVRKSTIAENGTVCHDSIIKVK